MAKLLLSWIAVNHDFIRNDESARVNPDGPTAEIHRYFWKYDRHLLLSQKSEAVGDPAMTSLQGWFNKEYPDHPVEPVYLAVDDIISVSEIRGKVEKLLLRHSDDEMEILVSTGTSSMMTAWYFVHLGLGLKTTLFQLRPKQFTKHKEHGEPIYENLVQSTIPSSIAIHQTDPEKPTESSADFQLTPSIKPVYERAKMVAQTHDATCLILGPTGTGKEHLARFIHDYSAREGHPFIPVNCSALGSGDLLESRLFGYEPNTFTGQQKDGRAGIFEEANGGTVFLDEIGDADPEMQQMLLRVLQEKEIARVGATEPFPIDVRIIGATHRDLRQRCKEDKFRWDLYYRLSLAELNLPALQERGLAETRSLIDFFLESKRKKYRRRVKLRLSDNARTRLESYPFPGNIRELENLIESMYIFCGDSDEPAELPSWLRSEDESGFKLEDMEQQHIRLVYNYFDNNKQQTARALGIANNTLKSKLKKYKIE